MGTDLGGQGACDLGHGVEQRQRTGGQLDCLIGDRRGTRLEQSIGLGTISCEVKVGEQGQVLTQVLVLAGDRLFHLDHHLANLPRVGGVADDLRTLRDIFLIRDRGTDACALLDVNLVAPPDELMDANGGDGDPELVVLDLGRDCDTHVLLLRNCLAASPRASMRLPETDSSTARISVRKHPPVFSRRQGLEPLRPGATGPLRGPSVRARQGSP